MNVAQALVMLHKIAEKDPSLPLVVVPAGFMLPTEVSSIEYVPDDHSEVVSRGACAVLVLRHAIVDGEPAK